MYTKILYSVLFITMINHSYAGGGFESYIENLRQQAYKKELIAKNFVAYRKIIRAQDRGVLSSDWLQGYYTFNYGSFVNEFMNSFGSLKILNEEAIKPKKGFKIKSSTQEDVLTIPLQGEMIQKDFTGRINSIKDGEIQLLSSGSGMLRTEFNPDSISELKYLQLSIKSNNKISKIQYQKDYFDPCGRSNHWQKIASPSYDDGKLKLNQDAWVFLNSMEQNLMMKYQINKKGNGIYVFVIKGTFKVNGETLDTKDGMAVWAQDDIHVQALTDENEILVLEIPVNTVKLTK